MNRQSIWSVQEECLNILGDHYGYPAWDRTAAELGISSEYFSFMAAGVLFETESFTVKQYMGIFPYGQAWKNNEVTDRARLINIGVTHFGEIWECPKTPTNCVSPTITCTIPVIYGCRKGE